MGANRKESQQINFRVNDDEFERLEQMAKESQMSVPAFCKKKAQGARMRSPKINREGAFEISRELRAIGNNVNQLSKRANEGNAISNEELRAIREGVNGIWLQLSEALQK